MNREEILRMAREAAIPFNKWGLIGCEGCEQDIDNELVRLAALIEQATIERCANRAGIALLGADRSLANRVDQAIRALKEQA